MVFDEAYRPDRDACAFCSYGGVAAVAALEAQCPQLRPMEPHPETHRDGKMWSAPWRRPAKRRGVWKVNQLEPKQW